MFQWLRQVILYVLLLFCRNKEHDRFVKEVTRNGKIRRNRKHIPGIREELDEHLSLPPDCYEELYFAGFTKDGHLVSLKLHRRQTEFEIAQVALSLPSVGDFLFDQARRTTHGIGKLSLQQLEPMKKWKIDFRGAMDRMGTKSQTQKRVSHVSVSLYWQCLADPYDHWTMPSTWQLAGNMKTQSLQNDIFDRVSGGSNVWYEQWGEMWGRIEVEGHETEFVRLKSFRSRKIARVDRSHLDETVVSQHLVVDGSTLYLTNGCVLQKDSCNRQFGYVTYPIGERWSTDQSSLSTANAENTSVPSLKYPFTAKANGIPYDVDLKGTRSIAITMGTCGLFTELQFSHFTVNDKMAYGIQLKESSMLQKSPSLGKGGQILTFTSNPNTELTIVDFKREDCRNSCLVGGKGANLAALTQLGHVVPKGICVTTEMLKAHIRDNTPLQEAQHILIDAMTLGEDCTDVLKVRCTEAVKLFTETRIDPTIRLILDERLKLTFGENYSTTTALSIRSSGVSEDGSAASSAGQLETFLGVKGLDNILEAISKCWASSLAYRVVEYRRQNGQALVESMGVVIQTMVDAEVAGVLFTNDPVTSSTTVMSINASYGLGETVVSGSVTPDTIRVRRGRDFEVKEILAKQVGEKDKKLVLVDSFSLKEIENNLEETKDVCLSDEMITNLCDVGLQIEEQFGCPQDIEWAISKRQIYLLQARPVTTLAEETDEELIHEFDTPVPMDTECLTTCNIGEMFPGTGTPLTGSIFVLAVNDCLAATIEAASGLSIPLYSNRCAGISTNKYYLDMSAICVSMVDGGLVNKSDMELYIVGRPLEEHTPEMIKALKGRRQSKLTGLRCFISSLLISKSHVKKFHQWAKGVDHFSVGDDASTALELFNRIDEKLPVFHTVWHQNMSMSGESTVAFGIILGMLRGKSGLMSRKCQADMAVLLASCKNVYSADVPSALGSLAAAISKSSIKDQFLNLSDVDCHTLLLGCKEEDISEKYKDFLKKQGHRCVKEAELMIKSWAEEPSKLMKALKQIINSTVRHTDADRTVELTNTEIVSKLETSLSWFQKYLISKVFLDQAKAGVASREFGKSVTIKMTDAFKKAYWRLATMTVKEGFLPEEKLMFFLTHMEIGELLETRSVALVRKARRRMKIMPQQDAIEYPAVWYGQPKPLDDNFNIEPAEVNVEANGMPVGRGVATGRACVVTCLEDAVNIQRGDILICPSTDVGWSPYFPLISGLVTEKGGFTSHGAVVAREVGIPCVVSVENATRLFQTGDRVKIDGLGGSIQRIDID